MLDLTEDQKRTFIDALTEPVPGEETARRTWLRNLADELLAVAPKEVPLNIAGIAHEFTLAPSTLLESVYEWQGAVKVPEQYGGGTVTRIDFLGYLPGSDVTSTAAPDELQRAVNRVLRRDDTALLGCFIDVAATARFWATLSRTSLFADEVESDFEPARCTALAWLIANDTQHRELLTPIAASWEGTAAEFRDAAAALV